MSAKSLSSGGRGVGAGAQRAGQCAHNRNTPRRLVGWKRIAGYLDVSIRTAQRWTRTRGLPVHQVKAAGLVWAFISRLDAWSKRPIGTPSGLVRTPDQHAI